MYIVKITNNTPLCKMVNFSRSVLKIYTGQKKFTRAAPVAPVTNIRYEPIMNILIFYIFYIYFTFEVFVGRKRNASKSVTGQKY